jgi:uncharacterized protein YecT (DUF1311 family)
MPHPVVTAISFPLALGFALSFAQAANAEAINCAKAASTVEMNFYADRDFKAADNALNATYSAALDSLKTRDLEKPYDAGSFEEAMRASQRTWVAYRDADCKDLVAQEWSGGTGATSAILQCMTDMTIQRTKEIRQQFNTC